MIVLYKIETVHYYNYDTYTSIKMANSVYMIDMHVNRTINRKKHASTEQHCLFSDMETETGKVSAEEPEQQINTQYTFKLTDKVVNVIECSPYTRVNNWVNICKSTLENNEKISHRISSILKTIATEFQIYRDTAEWHGRIDIPDKDKKIIFFTVRLWKHSGTLLVEIVRNGGDRDVYYSLRSFILKNLI